MKRIVMLILAAAFAGCSHAHETVLELQRVSFEDEVHAGTLQARAVSKGNPPTAHAEAASPISDPNQPAVNVLRQAMPDDPPRTPLGGPPPVIKYGRHGKIEGQLDPPGAVGAGSPAADAVSPAPSPAQVANLPGVLHARCVEFGLIWGTSAEDCSRALRNLDQSSKENAFAHFCTHSLKNFNTQGCLDYIHGMMGQQNVMKAPPDQPRQPEPLYGQDGINPASPTRNSPQDQCRQMPGCRM